mmetsp:Transcript_27556/g.70190  ORF Transcript_27556/g.70190 Transcript_27556/m.70190 type:complete len:289 (-) Transcript_27556:276-1142(-)|eukprot:CAMPEP_0202868420 /NCGR_PEP_ID=MMETSP1391-20130828/10867_1 /ASSEMBLY_ACC=CAM_ASM_000867 /TAXON_ID=1034604 /ORGANISM="Chlamydomonas leiostraca, Strain SAG 11-49" /LENGTH=288 /DNA_ID=CAMNT_0049548593 /DNA_START=226 /DNA_END=1092 /DNA_ORIENTATION=-
MSYQDLVRSGGGQQAPAAGLLRSQGGAGGLKNVESMLLKLANQTSTLKKHVDLLGGPKDTVDHRHKISATNTTIQDLARQVKDVLTQAAGQPSSSGGPGLGQTPEEAARQKRLLQDFAAILQDYKATQKIAQERESASLPKPNPTPPRTTFPASAVAMEGAPGSGSDRALEQQALLQAQKARESAALEAAMTHNEALIEERDAGIREIAGQIAEVNEMFQDLAVLINDQGVQVRTIDEQISATAERTKEGVRELVKADRSQRAYRNKCLWLWLVAALVVSIILILMFA